MEIHLAILKDKGFKITPLRKEILSAFQKKRATLTAEKLCRLIRSKIPNVGLQSVYRNLADFTNLGITEEVYLERRKAAYALCYRVADHHHHAVCRRCSRTIEIDICKLDTFAHIKRETGFFVENHSLHLKGLCRACYKRKK